MAEGTSIVEANLADFWSLVKHPLNFKDPVTRDMVRKIAFGAMRGCSREEAQKIQRFLDKNGCG